MPVNIEEILKALASIQDQSREAPIKEQLSRLLPQLKTVAQEQETERNRLLAANREQQTTISTLQSTVAAREKDVAEQAKTIEELKKRLAGVGTATTATPLNLATSFKGVIEAIQAEARKTPGVGTTIKSMDLEVKGLVQVQGGVTSIVLPTVGTPVDAGALSTLRVSFGAIPVVGPQAPPGGPGPGPPPPTPAAAPPTEAARPPKPAPKPRRKRG